MRKFGRNFEAADPADIADLLALVDAVPYAEFVGRKPLLLNPTFGSSSRAVGGADADIVTGDAIIDVKTLKAAEVQTSHLDQLLHYLLLARREHAADPAAFPAITRAGLYFSRHASLWTVDAAEWADHPDFPALEDWYFRHAAEVYGAVPNAPSG